MNNRMSNISGDPKLAHGSARRWIVATLTEEILGNPSTQGFLLESEYQLCCRFGVSRVTVRLALDDLKHRGLVYRKHGIGTFAHGRSTRVHRHIGVLMKLLPALENKSLIEFLRGVQAFVRPLGSALIVIDHSPGEWHPELAGVLAGVIVLPEQVTACDLASLKHRSLPFVIVGPTDLPGSRLKLDQRSPGDGAAEKPSRKHEDYFGAGQRAAEVLTKAFLMGDPMSVINVVLPLNNSGDELHHSKCQPASL